MKELVVISGKGGTGKTSVVAALASLSAPLVLADCDVDAADLYLVIEHEIIESGPFRSGKTASVLVEDCVSCGKCAELCRFGAISFDGPENGAGQKTYQIDPYLCEGCGVCVRFCPADAIAFAENESGDWFVSRTRIGSMAHARLGVAEENSGKLVTLVRTKARELAEEENLGLVIVDGSPGIGCPVIASVTGADAALVVTEPTLSGLHDMKRVCELTRHFRVDTFVCLNKADLNAEVADRIEQEAKTLGARVLGRIPYDENFTAAQMHGVSIVEHGESRAADAVRGLWKALSRSLVD